MKVLVEKNFDNFSLYFLGSSNVPDGADAKKLFQPVLELTHNHGTENDDEFKHYNGNEEGRQGFGHIGFLVDDVYKACNAIQPMGYGFCKELDGGSMKGLAFAFNPDGYSVEIVPHGGIDFGDAKKESS
jgi:lactoylglutathione lyase